MPEWREFEQLAVRIYESLVPQGAVVTHDDRIRGHLSGIDRQIDVSVRFEVASHRFLTIVQAKDLSVPADVNVVSEFAGVIEDVRANKGVLICRSGFTSAALTFAASKGIDTCNVHDAGSQKWALEIRVPILWTDLTPLVTGIGAGSFVGGDSVPGSLQDWVISSDGGTTRVDVLGSFERAWNQGRLPREVGTMHHVRDPSKTFQIRAWDADQQVVWRDFDLDLSYTIRRRSFLGTFSPEQCTGLLHYEDGRFVGTFPPGSIPQRREDEWTEIDDPDLLSVQVPGSLVVSEGWQVIEGSANVTDLHLTNVESGEVVRAQEGPDGAGRQ